MTPADSDVQSQVYSVDLAQPAIPFCIAGVGETLAGNSLSHRVERVLQKLANGGQLIAVKLDPGEQCEQSLDVGPEGAFYVFVCVVEGADAC